MYMYMNISKNYIKKYQNNADQFFLRTKSLINSSVIKHEQVIIPTRLT